MTTNAAGARIGALLGASLLLPAGDLAAQEPAEGLASLPRPVADAVPAGGPLTVDGELREPSWREAAPMTGLLQREPSEGEPASQLTEVRLLYTDEALYVGAWLFDDGAEGIVRGERVRDADLARGDAFLIVLDTFRDRQSGFLFGTNPEGVEYDGHITMDGHPGASGRFRESTAAGFNINWDGSWSVATSRDDAGWYVEMRIPFSTLRYAGGEGAVWGLNVVRRIRRTNEESYWAPVSRRHSIHRVSLAGSLRGLDLPVQRILALTPYVLQEARRDETSSPDGGPPPDGPAETEFPSSAGLDVKVGLTSSVTLDLTYNTDFAQVEVDDERIDLTRFNLFFPEKRPFFLENAGLFTVGAPGWLELFYSRRIGIGPDGVEVPIEGGGRITGTVGSFSGGLLHVRTGAAEGLPGNRYTVGRLQHRFSGDSRLGVMVTRRVAEDDPSDDNHMANLDGRFWLGPNTFLEGYAARTWTPGLEGPEHSFYLNLSHEGDAWLPRISYMEAGGDFNPEVGFVSRVDFRVPTVSLQRRIRVPSVAWLREIRPQLHYNGFFDFDGFLETHSASLRARVDLESGAFFLPSVSHTIEGLKEPFPIHPGVEIPVGSHENVRTSLEFSTDRSEALSVGGTVEAGGFFSGSRRGLRLDLAARHRAVVAGEIRASYDRVELAEGSFDTRLVGLRLEVTPTPSLSFSSLVQYSSQARRWTTNVRVGWLQAAGTGLFVVLDDSRPTEVGAAPSHRGITVKYTRRFDLAW